MSSSLALSTFFSLLRGVATPETFAKLDAAGLGVWLWARGSLRSRAAGETVWAWDCFKGRSEDDETGDGLVD